MKKKHKRPSPSEPHLIYRKGNNIIEKFLRKQGDNNNGINRQTNNSIEPSDLRK